MSRIYCEKKSSAESLFNYQKWYLSETKTIQYQVNTGVSGPRQVNTSIRNISIKYQYQEHIREILVSGTYQVNTSIRKISGEYQCIRNISGEIPVSGTFQLNL